MKRLLGLRQEIERVISQWIVGIDESVKAIESVKDEEMKKILDYFFNGEFAVTFKESPAAMYIHHGWIHGLLEHTLSVTKVCDNIMKIQFIHDTRTLLVIKSGYSWSRFEMVGFSTGH